MKRNIAIIGSILLVLSILVFFTGCPQLAEALLTHEQQSMYNEFIENLAFQAKIVSLPAVLVESQLKAENKNLRPFNFMIEDKTPGSIAQGTTVKDLKKRFIPYRII